MKKVCKHLHIGYIGNRSSAECTADTDVADCPKSYLRYKLSPQCWDEVRYCDYCGTVISGLYSTCETCGKDICAKHRYPFTNEETSLCIECARKKHMSYL